MKRTMTSLAALAIAGFGTTALAQDAVELRMMWYSDGVEGEVMQDLLDRFEAENPDIDVVLDNVAYQVTTEQLPIALAGGDGPDIARVAANLKSDSEHWLDLRPYVADAAYWEDNFGSRFDWMRPTGDDKIPGFMTQLTMVGGFANATLFEQAGVEIPGEDATWDEWVAAADQVAQDQGLPAAFAVDRSGHRISGPNASFGADYIGEDGMPAPIDDGTMDFVSKLVNWTKEGKQLPEVWVSAAGTTYRSGADDFINAQIPFLYSGSWQVANLSTKIGDGFDWLATGSPCGTAGCSGLAGGAGLVAVKYTDHPEEVARVMDYLASEPVVREFSERTLFLPAHAGIVAAGGLNFQSDDPNVPPALGRFVQASGETLPLADQLPAWEWSSVYYGALVTRVSQAMAGEITLDEARMLMDEDIMDAVQNASQ